MKLVKYLIVLSIFITLNGCNNNDNPPITSGILVLNFTHNWDGVDVTSTDFNDIKFTNANNDIQSITKIRYLVSNIILHQSSGENIELTGYFLVDLTNNSTVAYITNIPFATYSNLSFTFGFDEIDNIDGAYPDLNSASWNWPEMLGGGYHFMQLEGKYDDAGTESPYAYHMGTAKNPASGEFEQNYFNVNIDGFSMTTDVEVEIKMNIAEWFKNPYTWDLDVYNIELMPNYDAQRLMNQNGQSIFNLGTVN